MRQYYFHDGVQQHGPFTLEQLKSKNLSLSSLIWHTELTEWCTVADVPEIAAQVNVPPPIDINTAPAYTPTTTTVISQTVPQEAEKPRAGNKKSYTQLIAGAAIAASIIAIFIWIISSTSETLVASSANGVQNENSSQSNGGANQAAVDESLAKEEERKRINAALTAKNMEYRNNWQKYIGVGTLNYNASGFGGMEAFQFSVVNNTDYILDEMQVQLAYIKDNGDLYKVEAVTVYNVLPNSVKWSEAPGSSRGTSVSADVTGIISKKMHFCFPYHSGNDKDPYFCK